MATRAAAPLLNLSTLVEQPMVQIDQKRYPLLVPDALSLLACQKLSTIIDTIDALSPKLANGTLSDDENAELETAFAQVCQVVLAAPPDVQRRLTSIQRLYIYQAFLQLPQQSLRLMVAMATNEATPTASRSTGASSSRASRGSTTSARKSGSTAPSASPAPIS